MHPFRRRCAIVSSLAVAFLAAVAVPPARADGDPASDVLYSQSIFLPTDVAASAAERATLAQLVRASRLYGVPVKVAVIGSPYDLGSVTALWRRPDLYARFLGAELAFVYPGDVLVVMKQGIGVSRAGRPGPRAESSQAAGDTSRGLLPAAIAAVRHLAKVRGVSLPTTNTAPPVRPRQHQANDRRTLLALLAGALLVAAAWTYSLHARPLRPAR